MTNFVIFILDKVNQFFCSHNKRWQSSQEVKRQKFIPYGDNFTCSFETRITHEVHCNKCGKKWDEFTFE